jgi:hypothetical protein
MSVVVGAPQHAVVDVEGSAPRGPAAEGTGPIIGRMAMECDRPDCCSGDCTACEDDDDDATSDSTSADESTTGLIKPMGTTVEPAAPAAVDAMEEPSSEGRVLHHLSISESPEAQQAPQHPAGVLHHLAHQISSGAVREQTVPQRGLMELLHDQLETRQHRR